MVSTTKWLGPAAVLCHRGASVWLHTMGYIKKVASCKVKPYELIDHDSVCCKCDNTSRKVMLEDSLEDVKMIMDEARLQNRDEMKQADMNSYIFGPHYLKVENSVNF